MISTIMDYITWPKDIIYYYGIDYLTGIGASIVCILLMTLSIKMKFTQYDILKFISGSCIGATIMWIIMVYIMHPPQGGVG